MSEKIAIKRLTASDLTFFEWHFRNRNAGNQKAINLNADVFIEKMYPSLPDLATGLDGRIPLDLSLYGPGLAGELNLQRKIIKIGSYKNWRLNGEFVYNPESDPTRFNNLAPGDIAVLEFSGAVQPTACRAFLLAAAVAEDQEAKAAFDEFLGGKSMEVLSAEDTSALLGRARLLDSHPIRALTLQAELEEAAAGGSQARERLYARPSGRRLTVADLRRARENVEDIGQAGEELVNAYLTQIERSGEIDRFTWVSAANAIAPFDFMITRESGAETPLDVKSTTGDFSRPIHVSLNEVRAMIAMADYAIYRVYEIGEGRAKLRIAANVRTLANQLLESLRELPEGISADSFSVSTDCLEFGPELVVQLLESEETVT